MDSSFCRFPSKRKTSSGHLRSLRLSRASKWALGNATHVQRMRGAKRKRKSWHATHYAVKRPELPTQDGKPKIQESVVTFESIVTPFLFQASEDSICVSQRSFAIGICIAGLILMLCVIAAIICLLARRRSKKTTSNPTSSIYSGPYTNTAYSHTS